MTRLLLKPLGLAIGLALALPVQAENLIQVYEKALENDATLRAAQQNRLAVFEAMPQAKAAVLPGISASGQLSRNHVQDRSSANNDYSYNNKQLQLQLTQTLYNRAQFLQLDLAETQTRQADIDYSAAEQDLLLRVSEAYFNVLKANSQLQLARADLAAVQRQLEQAEKRFEVGLIAITDVADAKASYDQSSALVITSENQVNNAQAALATLTGIDYKRLADVRTDIETPAPEPRDMHKWVETALEQNLKVRSAEIGNDIARQGIELQRSGHYPTVNLNASYGYQDTNLMGRDIDQLTPSIGVQLSVPLYTGGAVGSKTREATYRFQEAQDKLEGLRRDTRRQTEDAYRGVLTNISSINAYRQAVESARTKLAATEAGYEVGTRTIVDVLNAERAVFSAMRDYLNARYDYLLTNLRLKSASGQLAPQDLNAVNSLLEEREINPLIAPLMKSEG
ncbi:MAG: TolC family outer membrane protein [Halothiobacillaceae bacterium]|jgi:outer membrane protein|nr:TolC family outer membrane protein [Halothiobacillaceae bacterium]